MSNLDADIDRLYQLPLAEFTPARNELAKRAGKAGAEIRALQKPNAAAWAVNQLYWRKRAVFDRLVEASRQLRGAHGRVLAGKAADVAEAEAGHRVATKAAAEEIRRLLEEAGEAASAPTLSAVTETLQALPGSAPVGRLTRPLKPMGFEALAGLVPRGGATLRALTAVPANPPAPASARGAKPDPRAAARAEAAAKRDAADRQRRIAAMQKDLRAAVANLKIETTALARARQAHGKNARERAHLQDQLQFAVKQTEDRLAEVRRHEQRAAEIEKERANLEAAIASLKEA
jgi:hypothetical protein